MDPDHFYNSVFEKNGGRFSTRAELSNMFAGWFKACIRCNVKSWDSNLLFLPVWFWKESRLRFQKMSGIFLDTSLLGGIQY